MFQYYVILLQLMNLKKSLKWIFRWFLVIKNIATTAFSSNLRVKLIG